MRPALICASALAFAITASSAIAADLKPRDANARAAQVQHEVALAHQTGDAATIADAQAKLKAAQAAQWSATHPAPDPSKQLRSAMR